MNTIISFLILQVLVLLWVEQESTLVTGIKADIFNKRLGRLTIFPLFADRFERSLQACYLEFDKEAIG